MNYKNICLTAFLLLTFVTLWGQKDARSSTKKDSIKQMEVQVFEDVKVAEVFQRVDNPIKNTLKFGLLEIINGDIPFYFERAVTSKLTVEAGLGFNFQNGIIGRILSLDLQGDDYTVTKNKLGAFSALSLKYFPSSRRRTAPEGTYVGLGIQYKENRFLTAVPTGTSTIKYFDYIRIFAGYTRIYDNFVSEFRLGVGVRQTQKNILEVGYLPEDAKVSPIFIFAYNLGFAF